MVSLAGNERQDELEQASRQGRHRARAAAGRGEPHALREHLDGHAQVLQVLQARQPGEQQHCCFAI